jgi:hypothetical protein
VAWARVQSKSNSSTASTTLTITFTGTPVAGNKVAVFVSCVNGTTVSTVKDGNLVSLTQGASSVNASNVESSLWFYDVPATPSTTFTVTASGSSNLGGDALEVSGLLAGNTTACLDGACGLANGTASPAAPTYSSTKASEFLFTYFGDWGNSSTCTVPSGLTLDASSINTSANANACVGYGNTSGGSDPTSWSFTAAPSQWAAFTGAFKLAAPGGGAVGARPGRTWRRRFKHRQKAAAPPPEVAAPPPTPGPLVAGPPFAWPVVPPPVVTSSEPLGNPATGTPQPLVVTTPWAAPATEPLLLGPGAPAAVVAAASTIEPLVAGPTFAWPAIPPVAVTSNKPLGNPAVGTGGPLVVSTTTVAKVPGALLFGPGAPPPPVTTVATPGPLVVTPPFAPVPIPDTTITWSAPLGNPATSSPQPLIITPPFTATQVPGADIFTAPAAPAVTAVGTPGLLVIGPPWQPVTIPRNYLTWSQPLGRPAVGSPKPLLVGPIFRWPVWTASLLSSGFAPVAVCFTPRPSTGTTARPDTGSTAYALATTARPSTGITVRPDTGETENPC